MVRVQVRLDAHDVIVAVQDGNSILPSARTASAEDERGRGLTLVAAVSQDWGVETLPHGGKRVWARL
jgi:hypothetical protein